MKRRIFLVLVLLVVAFGVWTASSWWSIKQEIYPLAPKVLTLLDEGKVKTVWEQASPKLRTAKTLAAFRLEVEGVTKLLGRLKETGEVRGWKLRQKNSERHVIINLAATYEAGTFMAILEFEDLDDGKWRLRSMAYEDLPEAKAQETPK